MNLAHGIVMGWPSPTIPLLRANGVTEEEGSWLGSLPYLAALISSPFFSYVNQNLGRKAAGYLSAVPNVIGWLLIAFGNSTALLCVGRFVLGLGLSGMNVFVTLYIGEISEDCIRGALGVIRGLGLDLGFVLIYIVGSYLSIFDTAIISVVLPAIFIVPFFLMPESPMFLLGKGRDKEAFGSYLWMRGGDVASAQEEMSKLSAVVLADKKVTLKELLSVRGTRKALVIALVLAVCQQFSGLGPVYSYCAVIFETTGGHFTPQVSSFIVSGVGLAASFLGFFFSDKIGRRILLISTYTLQGVCLVILGLYLYMQHIGESVSQFGILPIICISLYCFFVVVGPCNLYYVVLSEIFRPEARGIAMGLTSTFVWFLAFLSIKFYSALVNELEPHGCFWLFAAISFVGAIFVFFALPETKNRSLELILLELNGVKQ